MKELLEKCQGSVLSETKEHLYSDFKSGRTDTDDEKLSGRLNDSEKIIKSF